ncbi:septal ring lytic transglycosylase RlpA family protein [bacterium]|nr:septal ring lytic transglycosylase RlpA family protein [bacterium]
MRLGRTGKRGVVGFILLCAVWIAVACSPAPIYTSTRGERPVRRPSTATTPGKPPTTQQDSFRKGQILYGEASFYGPGFHGNLTANGETYDQNAMTCAHKTLPFGTMLKVTYLDSRKSVIVRVNDRGPYKKGRIIDLSVEAARRIGMTEAGTGTVSAEIISLGEG